MVEIQNTLVSLDLFSRKFCCDLAVCKGCCCIEGDAGAPVEIDEIAQMEEALDVIWDELNPNAQQVIKESGIVYPDASGELVTNLIKNRDCVFAQHTESGACYCVFDKAYRDGRISFQKPVSCHLYPVRLKLIGGMVGVNYDQWGICQCGVELGEKIGLPLYKFLKEPLIRRFGEDWWNECDLTAKELAKAGFI